MSVQIVPIGSLEAKPPRWLWDEYLLRGGINLIVGVQLTTQEKADLVAFLRAL